MSNLIPFNFESKKIRVVIIGGQPMFSARDVALALGYENPAKAYQDHCKHLKKLSYNESLQLNWANPNPQGEYVMPEGDLYRLVAKSQLESAERFELWVYDEVLPSIRKYGRYEGEKIAQTPMRATDALLKLPAYAESIKSIFPNLGEHSLQEIISRAVNEDIGYPLLPQPTLSEPFYTATQLAKEFGVSANRIGRIANACGLKSEEFGEYRLSKSQHSSKQVEQFHYNEKGRAALALMLAEAAEA